MSIFSKIKKKITGIFSGKSNSAMASWPQATQSTAMTGAISSINANAAANKNQQMGVQSGVQGYTVQNSPLGQIAVNDKDGSFMAYNASSGPTGPTYYNTTPQAQAARVAALNQQRTLRGGTTIAAGNSQTVNNASFNPDLGMTPQNLRSGGTSSDSGVSSLSGASGGSSSSGASGSMATTPGYSNPGLVTTAGEATNSKGLWARNPQTGELEPVPQEVIDEEAKKKPAYDRFMEGIGMPKRESVLGSSEVQAAQAAARDQQKVVNDLTAQLNQVVAKQREHVSRVREIGSNEGVTETVFDQQETNINRNYMTQALPIQAQIAAAQGNLEYAQTALRDLVALKTEDVNNEYEYQKNLFNFVKERGDKDDKKKGDALEKDRNLAEKLLLDNINFAQSLASNAFNNGDGATGAALMNLIQNPKSPTFANDVQRVAGNSRSGGLTSVTSQVIDGFTSLKDLTPTEAQKVRSDLYAKGFGSDTPPEWFKGYIEEEAGKRIGLNKPLFQPDSVVKKEWIAYRDKVLRDANKDSSVREV